MEQNIDDGSLAFLGIGRNPNSRSFNCETTRQSKLVNTSFWVTDYMKDVETRYSKAKGTSGQTLVMIKDDPNDPESEARKFFTGSADIIYVLDEIAKRNAFPRKVTIKNAAV